MLSSQLRLQAASADLPAGSQLWHPGGHRLVPVYEKKAVSVITQHYILLSPQRWGETLPMAKETLPCLPLCFKHGDNQVT